jgi:cytochrome c
MASRNRLVRRLVLLGAAVSAALSLRYAVRTWAEVSHDSRARTQARCLKIQPQNDPVPMPVHEAPSASPPEASPKPPPRFVHVLLLLGGLLLAGVLGDLILRGFKREVEPPIWETSRSETAPGRQAIIRHGCGGCHVIPGIRHATGRVGPRLTGFRDQMYIAGVLPNTPENLAAWIRSPQQFSPGTAMPNLGVTDAEAQAIAIYLNAHP